MFSFDAFVSYSRKDQKIARQIVYWLRSAGLKIWFDEEQLVPGTRFRSGLEQGIRESRHLISILTKTYSTRKWTQREIDLFDISVCQADRKILGIKMDDGDIGILDQVFQVHQRISWQGIEFDSKAFWLLYCGLNDLKPGSRTDWAQKGKDAKEGKLNNNPNSRNCTDKIHSFSNHLTDQIQLCLSEDSLDWKLFFKDIKVNLEKSFDHGKFLDLWAVGNSEYAAMACLLNWPNIDPRYGAWPFIDLGISNIANNFLIAHSLKYNSESEMWFSWAISEQNWAFLKEAACKASPGGLKEHFLSLSKLALTKKITFTEAIEIYDYGVMITPWNHFHLTWLAVKLNDTASAKANAIALCNNAFLGDIRAGRFISRLCNWDIFFTLRNDTEVFDNMVKARAHLKLEDYENLPRIKDRISKLWSELVYKGV